jgi:hypothetical protein
MTPQHRPTPYMALIAGLSLSLWLLVSAGVHTAMTHPTRLPEPPASAAREALIAAPMPSPGADLFIDVR